MPEWVQITHPSLGVDQEPGLVTKEAYLEVHKAAGWRLYKAPTEAPSTPPPAAKKPAAKTVKKSTSPSIKEN